MRKDICHLSLQKPPEFLFCSVEGDLAELSYKHGLKRMKMPFIEMYENEIDARKRIPFQKHPYVFVVMADMMYEDGYKFSSAETGEWILDDDIIPPRYLRLC